MQANDESEFEGPLPDRYTSRGRSALPSPAIPSAPQVPQVLRTMGLCWQLPPGLFIIDNSADDPAGAAQAKAACAACPVRATCLEYALDYEPYGIWGGFDAAERRRMRGRPVVPREDRADVERILDAFRRGVTAGEVAAAYGVARRTVERWRSKAGLTVPRGGGEGAAEQAA